MLKINGCYMDIAVIKEAKQKWVRMEWTINIFLTYIVYMSILYMNMSIVHVCKLTNKSLACCKKIKNH